ncbi:hypothetical protein NIES2104_61140 [Leptolyngbya sp. NIES-2104]|nr:hypothetical protein NIES2104_61140 [Leptolyngbya sp. NIES-2104]
MLGMSEPDDFVIDQRSQIFFRHHTTDPNRWYFPLAFVAWRTAIANFSYVQ